MGLPDFSFIQISPKKSFWWRWRGWL